LGVTDDTKVFINVQRIYSINRGCWIPTVPRFTEVSQKRAPEDFYEQQEEVVVEKDGITKGVSFN
jgi:hypothetical protein